LAKHNYVNQTHNCVKHAPLIIVPCIKVKRIFSISLALLMLVSSVGFSMNTHFCGGEAVKSTFTLGLHNPDCGMAMMEMECEKVPSKEDQLTKKPCCENHHQLLQLDENADIQAFSIEVNSVFFVAFIDAFVQPVLFADQSLVHTSYYPPPAPDKDIQVLFQTFLI